MIEYEIGTSGQILMLCDEVLMHLHRHRQTKCWQREAGGQLFARMQQGQIHIAEATGPRQTDRRTRTSYIPDRKAEQREIAERHSRGLQFIGDWHTHPEAQPRLSSMDITSIADCVRKSVHSLNGFLLIVVGRDDFPDGLNVSISDGTRIYGLAPNCQCHSL